MRLDRYLAKVGLAAPLSPSLETLRRLHIAHLAAFPFENLEIQRFGAIRLDLESLERKFLDGGAGGYCFEQNTLFAAVLREIGFRVDVLMARVGPPDRRALNHILLRVFSDGKPWLADVGFGAEGPLEPIPLREGTRVAQHGVTFSLDRDEYHWVLKMEMEGAAKELYEFSGAPHTPADVEIANYFIATHPTSYFRQTLTVQRVTPEERLILRPTMITRWRDGIRSDTPIEPLQLRDLALELFGIDLGKKPLLFETLEADR